MRRLLQEDACRFQKKMTPLDLAPAAFIAGILMFLAPCTLPIVPGYLAFISGVSPADMNDARARGAARRKVLHNALWFVLGFGVVFISFGALAGFLGAHLGEWRYALSRLGGLLLIVFGLTMLGVRIPVLSGERRLRMPAFLSLGRAESSLLLGALFALGWSPCIGPVLGSVLFLASSSSTALSGAALLTVFWLGLALPFLLTAALISEAGLFMGKLNRVAGILEYAGGLILVVLGLLMLTGTMGLLVTWGFAFLEGPYQALLRYM